MRRNLATCFIVSSTFLAIVAGFAQNRAPIVEARLIPDSIAIGEQFELEVTVDLDIMQLVGFPEFPDGTIGEVIEILEEHPVDTVARDGRRLKLSKRYLLTTFEDGKFNVGKYPLIYIDKNISDTIWSRDSMLLDVGTYEIDTITMTIFDIKGNLGAPFKTGEISGYVGIGLAVLALLLVGVWFLRRWLRRRPVVVRSRPDDPPHVKAIMALEILHNQKVWQNNRHKLYYTKLTDILREYIEERYHIKAMEMTSEEILSALLGATMPGSSINELRQVLRSADLVKFAKFVPDGEHNEMVYNYSYFFVENTKEDGAVTASAEEEMKL